MKQKEVSTFILFFLSTLLFACMGCSNHIALLPATNIKYTPVNIGVVLSVQHSEKWDADEINDVINSVRFSKTGPKTLFLAAALSSIPKDANEITDGSVIRFANAQLIVNGSAPALINTVLEVNKTAIYFAIPKSVGIIMPHLLLQHFINRTVDSLNNLGYCIDTIKIATISPSNNLYESDNKTNAKLIEENERLYKTLLGDWYAIIGTNNEPVALAKKENHREGGGYLKVSMLATKPDDPSMDETDWNKFISKNTQLKTGTQTDTVNLYTNSNSQFAIQNIRYAGSDAAVQFAQTNDGFILTTPAPQKEGTMPLAVDLVVRNKLLGNLMLHKVFYTQFQNLGWFAGIWYAYGWYLAVWLAVAIAFVVFVWQGIKALKLLKQQKQVKKNEDAKLVLWLQNQGLECTDANCIIAKYGATSYKVFNMGHASTLHVYMQKLGMDYGGEMFFVGYNNGRMNYNTERESFITPEISLLSATIFAYNRYGKPQQLQPGPSLAATFYNNCYNVTAVNAIVPVNPYLVSKSVLQGSTAHFKVYFHIHELQLQAAFNGFALMQYYKDKKAPAYLSAAINCNLWCMPTVSPGGKPEEAVVICFMPGGQGVCVAKLILGSQTTVELFDEFEMPRPSAYDGWKLFLNAFTTSSPGALQWLFLPWNEEMPALAKLLLASGSVYKKLFYNPEKTENYIDWRSKPLPILLLLQKEGRPHAKILPSPFIRNKWPLKIKLYGKTSYFLLLGLQTYAPQKDEDPYICRKKLYPWHYNTLSRLHAKKSQLEWNSDSYSITITTPEDYNVVPITKPIF